MKIKFLLIALLALPLLTGCGNGSDFYIKNHIVGSWYDFDGEVVLDKGTGRILYEDFDYDYDISDHWVFLKGGVFSDDGDVGTWTVKNGILVLDYEDGYDMEFFVVMFKNANEVYLLYDGDEDTLSVDYDALLLRRAGK